MTRVIGIHHLELNPGVTPQALEEFFQQEFLPSMSKLPDVKASLFKGDKGDRLGQYMLLFEFDSLEAREQFFVDEADRSPEIAHVLQSWDQLAAFKTTSSWGDFVTVSA